MSRISPTSRTSGSSRRAERSARSNEGLSSPISRWLTAESLWWCTYSTGSSIVRMWHARVSLMRSMMEASVVDFPEPVGPVTRTNPRGRVASHSAVGGRSSSAKLGTREGIIRSARAVSPLCVKALPRSRARSSQEKAKSTSCSVSNVILLRGFEYGPHEGVDLLARQDRGPFDRTEFAVDSDPWRRVTGQQEVGTLLVPEDLQPRRDRLGIDVVHRIASFVRRSDAEEPGPKAGLFGSSLRVVVLRVLADCVAAGGARSSLS